MIKTEEINVDVLKDEDYEDDSDNDYESALEVVTDLSNSLATRTTTLEDYYTKEGDNAIEIISTLASMYKMTGSKIIENYLYHICFNSKISSFLKLEAAKTLIDYTIDEEEIYDEDEEKEYKEERNTEIALENSKNKYRGYQALDVICMYPTNMPTPCRVEAICTLMESHEFKENANSYWCTFVCDQTLECDFRYKTLLNLESISLDILKNELIYMFDDKEFVQSTYESLKLTTVKLFPNIKMNKNSSKLWYDVLNQLPYTTIRSIYKQKFTDSMPGRDYFIKNSQFVFLLHDLNMTCYRVLAGQFLLQKFELDVNEVSTVESTLLSFAKDQGLDYDLRADAADVLLRMGTPIMKQEGRNVIFELGRINGTVRSVFENAQNVHTTEIEDSVMNTLEKLSEIPTLTINSYPIDFEYVNNHVEKMIKERRLALKCEGEVSSISCSYCESSIEEDNKAIVINTQKFCCDRCYKYFNRDEKIKLSMNRIFMDRALYSKYNNTLINILLKIYTYICGKDEEVQKQMMNRLLEELEDMSGTCSTGYATRLVNTLSGFGEFNISISFADQIVANFTSRVNIAVSRIMNSDSIFRKSKLNDVVELWLNNEDNKSLLETIEKRLNPSRNIKRPSISNVIESFLSESKEEKINICINDFYEAVLNELSVSSAKYSKRQNFSLFFRTYLSSIREELYVEFTEFVSSSDFDFAFRKAIMHYDSGF